MWRVKPPQAVGSPVPKRRKYPEGTTEKPCTKCGIIKALDAYMPLALGALGRHPVCSECRRAIAKDYTRKDREYRAQRLRPAHCDACGQPKTGRRALHWDHGHATRRFRGWLCHYCNAALGHVDDRIDRLEQLIAYLRRGGGPA